MWFCIPAHGHTNPTIEVVRELVKRGHEVRYYSFDEFREKNKKSVAEIRDLIDKVRNAFEKKNLTKKDREEILSALLQIENAAGSHNTFMAEQFNEAADGIIKEAKGEVEAFIQHKMNSLALSALVQEHTDPRLVGENMKAVMLEKRNLNMPETDTPDKG